MSYFLKFPLIISTVNDTTYLIRDFTRRIVLAENFQKMAVLLDDYFVLDGETPEMISYKLYDSATYHWVILNANNITDPREEWPVKNELVIEKIYLKYDFVLTVPSGVAY